MLKENMGAKYVHVILLLRKCLMMPFKCFMGTWESTLVFKVIFKEAVTKLLNNMIERVNIEHHFQALSSQVYYQICYTCSTYSTHTVLSDPQWDNCEKSSENLQGHYVRPPLNCQHLNVRPRRRSLPLNDSWGLFPHFCAKVINFWVKYEQGCQILWTAKRVLRRAKKPWKADHSPK